MTPAIIMAEKANIEFSIHEYEHEASAESYGVEAAEKMGVAPERVFKTLVASTGDKTFGVAIVPVTGQLNLKSFARALSVKRAEMADPVDVERITGYVLGGVSPLGQKKRLATVIDASAQGFDTVFVSAGRRGLEIELAPGDLARLTSASYFDVAQP